MDRKRLKTLREAEAVEERMERLSLELRGWIDEILSHTFEPNLCGKDEE